MRDGVMLRPPVIDVAETTIPMSRLSIYAGRTGGVTSFEKKVPKALACAWRAPAAMRPSSKIIPKKIAREGARRDRDHQRRMIG